MKTGAICCGVFARVLAVAVLVIALAGPRVQAAEVLNDFSLPYHTNHNFNLNLHDYAGKVILLDFFFATCGYCQQVAPVIKRDIADYYKAQNGNADGIPVVEIYINIGWFDNVSTTDAFMDQNGMEIVADDFTFDVFLSFFDNPDDAGTPHFVVVNGLTNSPSHLPWQILYNNGGFDSLDPGATVNPIRAAIDSIKAPNLPPHLGKPVRLQDGRIQFALTGQKGRTNVVEYSTNLLTWNTLGTVVNTLGTVPIIDNQAAPNKQRFYRAKVKE